MKKKSFFLFGPRQVGKSHLIKKQLKDCALIIDLLDNELNYRLQREPSYLKALIKNKTRKQKYVVIDEIQKIPELLNLVHLFIEEKKIHFLLTGSSSRKLKRKDVNLLAGRAWNAELFPLTWYEIPRFSLEQKLFYGSLPHTYLSKEPLEELKAYLSYFRKDRLLQYWQSRYGHEVDFVIEDHTAIEVKSSKRISKADTKTLKMLAEEEKFLKQLWNHEIF